MGVDALSYSVEIFDPHALGQYLPGRVRHIGRERYYAALSYAASIFPSGTVWSDLIVGLEHTRSTMRGIDELSALGVVPVLGVATRQVARGAPAPASSLAEDVGALGAHLYTVVKERGINMGWLRDLSTGMTPLEARFFVGEDARLAVAVQNFYRSKVGSLTARSLARFRRRLRVRAVSDSFDASGL
jgi:hypothetical protein